MVGTHSPYTSPHTTCTSQRAATGSTTMTHQTGVLHYATPKTKVRILCLSTPWQRINRSSPKDRSNKPSWPIKYMPWLDALLRQISTT
eukprot:10051888-Ditylum_brightwellii.AAC.1